MASLCNLQTLKLNQHRYLCKLPEGISELVSLRHFEIDNYSKFTPEGIPEGLGRLNSLAFFVWGEDGYKIGEVGNLNLLRGNVGIRNLARVADRDKATSAELMKKQCLHTLILNCESKRKGEWTDQIGDDEVRRIEGVL